ncbi:MAG: methionyl-tRNA formyltransferase [Bacillota bacterium]
MAEQLRIVTVGDPVLKKRARPVRRVNDSIRELLDSMVLTMRRAHGVGLAAPQVGVSKRVVVVETEQGLFELVNPEIVRAEGSEVGVEGCLSVPGRVGEVERYSKVCVSALDREGNRVWMDADGLLARAIQHEVDHLEGILFLDRAKEVQEVPQEPREERFLRVVFMGTPQFAVPSLYHLILEGHDVCLVVTRPDRPAGRGLKLQASPVKQFALAHRLQVIQPESLNAEEVAGLLRELRPDVIAVVAYGRIIPEEIAEIPTMGAVNVHPSLLPCYRGAAPIQRAIMNGDNVTGVSVIKLSPRLDAGDIIYQVEVPIEPADDYGSLSAKLAEVSGEALCKALRLMAFGQAQLVPQDETKASLAPALKAEDELINWGASAGAIVNQVRALSPVPGAYTYRSGKKLKVLRAREATWTGPPRKPGQMLCQKEQLLVGTGSGWVELLEVQPEGGRRMNVQEYLRGRPVSDGETLGEV